MKKKIKDLTLEELIKICKADKCCDCPFQDFIDCPRFDKLLRNFDDEVEVNE